MNRILVVLLLAGVLAAGVYVLTGQSPAQSGKPAAVASAIIQPTANPIEPITPLLAHADAVHGQQLARVCSACHSFEKGGPNKLGPNLWGIVGAPHAHKDDYAYSDALKAFPGTWDYESLNQFLYKPMQYVPGTKMGFVGLKKTQDRADIIAWLRTQSDTPAPLP